MSGCLPVGFIASLMAALLLSLPDSAPALAQRSGVRSGRSAVLRRTVPEAACSVAGTVVPQLVGGSEGDGSIRTQTRALLGPVDCGSGSAKWGHASRLIAGAALVPQWELSSSISVLMWLLCVHGGVL